MRGRDRRHPLESHHRAIEIYSDMLRLNPNDNQGVRYILAI
jgi:hypothetical protein